MMQRARVIAAKVKMFLILPMVIMNIQKMLVRESILENFENSRAINP